jgi:hypothetical protein
MSDQDKSQLFGEGLPGTGGDFIDGNDTEGHARNPRLPGVTDGGPESARNPRLPGATGDDEADVEGHRRNYNLPGATEGPEGVRNPRLPGIDGSDEADVEGHLFTGGPSTQGDFAKRVPSDNPHGER